MHGATVCATDDREVCFFRKLAAKRNGTNCTFAKSSVSFVPFFRGSVAQKVAGVAEGVAWSRFFSESLLDRDLFKLCSMQRHQLAHHLWSDPEGTFD